MPNQKSSVSVVIPLYNEDANLPLLNQKLLSVLPYCTRYFEIIYVNDGSTDSSAKVLERLAKGKSNVKVVNLRRNYGQTAAISAGIDKAKFEILVFLDADLQNDPADIPKLLDKMATGYDVVSGWRKNRHDPYFTKTLPSLVANKILAIFLNLPLHDIGCTLKAYRRQYLSETRLYGEMHRLLPYVAANEGARITEIEVQHHTRKLGKSHYSLDRTFKVLIDMIMLKLFYGYSNKPAYVFGSLGILLFFIAFFLSAFTLWERFFLGVFVHRNPIFLLSMFSLLGSVQFILLGFLTEFIMRTYFESQQKPTYKLRKNYIKRPKA